jgi:hypothetical protein
MLSFFPVCFYFSPVGSGVDVSNDSDVNIGDTEDQYLSIDIKFKKKNPEDLFLFWLSTTRQAAPL